MRKKIITLLMLAACNQSLGLNLNESLISAYNTNPAISAARDRLKSKDEKMYQALSGYLPDVRFVSSTNKSSQNRDRILSNNGGQYNSTDFGNIQSPRDKLTSQSHRFVVKQNLFQGGSSMIQAARAKAEIMAERMELLNTESKVLLQAIEAYVNVLASKKAVEINKKSLDYLNRMLAALFEKYRAGVIKRTNVAVMEQNVAQAMSNLIKAEGDLASSLSLFKKVTGIEANELANIAPSNNLPNGLKALIDNASKNNFSVLSAQYGLKMANSDVGLSLSNMLPSVDLEGSFSKNSNKFNSYTSPTQRSKNIALNVTIPIYQKGIEYSQERSAKAIASSARSLLKQAKEETIQRSSQVWSEYQSASAAYEAAKQQVKTASIALDGMKQEYDEGIVSITDFLKTQNDYVNADLNLVQSDSKRILKSYEIKFVEGTLTAKHLGLETKYYNPEQNYKANKLKFIGF